MRLTKLRVIKLSHVNILSVCLGVLLWNGFVWASDDDELKRLSVSQLEPFNLGTLAINSSKTAKMIVSPNGKIDKHNLQTTRRVTPELLSVCGEPNHDFYVELPEPVLVKQNGRTVATLSEFTSDIKKVSPITFEATLPRSGCLNFRIGATVDWHTGIKAGPIKTSFVLTARYKNEQD